MNVKDIIKAYFEENKEEVKFRLVLKCDTSTTLYVIRSDVFQYDSFLIAKPDTNDSSIYLNIYGGICSSNISLVNPVEHDWEYYLTKYKLKYSDVIKNTKDCNKLNKINTEEMNIAWFPSEYAERKIKALFKIATIRENDAERYGPVVPLLKLLNEENKDKWSISIDEDHNVAICSWLSYLPWLNFDTEKEVKRFFNDNAELIREYFSN